MKINPFIRHAQLLKISSPTQFFDLKSFDSRFFYCLDGQGDIEVEGVRHEMRKGCLMIWTANRRYSFSSGGENSMLLVGFNFDFSDEKSDLAMPIPPSKSDFFDCELITEASVPSEFAETIYLEGVEDFEGEILYIRREFSEKRKFYEQIAAALFCGVLHKVLRLTLSATDSKKSIHITDEIIKFISENYMQKITNKTLSERFNYHPNYLNMLMKTHTNMSLHQYLLSYRLSVALKLIQSTVLPISEVAEMSGFYDFAYFSKFFKKKMAKNPSDFRHSNCQLLI